MCFLTGGHRYKASGFPPTTTERILFMKKNKEEI